MRPGLHPLMATHGDLFAQFFKARGITDPQHQRETVEAITVRPFNPRDPHGRRSCLQNAEAANAALAAAEERRRRKAAARLKGRAP